MGGVASFQFQVGPAFSMPTLAPVLSGSLSASGALTLRWPAVATGQTTEVQQVNASGQQVSLFAGGVSVVGGTGTEEPDAQGVYCLLASGTSCVLQLPAGFTGAFRARTIGGGVATAPAGPWSNVVAESIPAGTPRIVYTVSNVRWTALYTTPGGAQAIGLQATLTVTNQGTASGASNIELALVDPNHSNTVVGYSGGFSLVSGPAVDQLDGTQTLAPGQSAVWQINLQFGGWWQYGEPLPVAGSTRYVLHVAPLTIGYERYQYENGSAFQADPGDVAFGLTYMSSVVSGG